MMRAVGGNYISDSWEHTGEVTCKGKQYMNIEIKEQMKFTKSQTDRNG